MITDFLRLCNGNPSEHTKVLQKISDGNPSFKSKWQLIKKLLAQVKILEIQVRANSVQFHVMKSCILQCKVAYAPLMTFSTGLYTSILFQIECKKQKQKFLVGSGGCYKVNSASNTDVYGIGVTLKVHQIAKCIQSNKIFLKINYVDIVIYCDDTDFDANVCIFQILIFIILFAIFAMLNFILMSQCKVMIASVAGELCANHDSR